MTDSWPSTSSTGCRAPSTDGTGIAHDGDVKWVEALLPRGRRRRWLRAPPPARGDQVVAEPAAAEADERRQQAREDVVPARAVERLTAHEQLAGEERRRHSRH